MKRGIVLLLAIAVGCFLSGCSKSESSNTASSNTTAESRSVLQTIETYKAPSSPDKETYDYRKLGGKPNPPTLTDAFIVDLWQRMSMDLKLQGITKNRVSEENVKQALNIYMERDWEKIAGYRPWTHWNFVRSLSPQDREALAKEVVRYMASNGVKEE